MKVLITGSTGFVGRRVVAQLSNAGRFEVIRTCRGQDASKLDGEIAVDLLVPGAAETLIAKVRPTHLLHLAWNVTPGEFWRAPDNLDWMASSLSLLRAFGESGGQRAVMAGTCAEYDWTTGLARFREDSPRRPSTLYGVAKDALYRVAGAAGPVMGVSVAWGRLFLDLWAGRGSRQAGVRRRAIVSGK